MALYKGSTLIVSGDSSNIISNNNFCYSTEERTVGIWIDGSTLYEKTINFGNLPDKDSKSILHDIENIDKIIYLEGIAINSNNGISFNIPGSDMLSPVCQYVNRASISIKTTLDYSDYNAYITIRYTKNR